MKRIKKDPKVFWVFFVEVRGVVNRRGGYYSPAEKSETTRTDGEDSGFTYQLFCIYLFDKL